MTLLSGIVSSSGTDVPLEDWVFLGADTTLSGTGSSFNIPIDSPAEYMGFHFMADLNVGATSSMSVRFNEVQATAGYRNDSVTNSGATTTTFALGTNLTIPVSAGRNLVTGTFYTSSIGEPEIFLIKTMYQSGSFWGMSTLAGQFDTGFNPSSFGLSSEWGAGSRLSLWGIPNGVAI